MLASELKEIASDDGRSSDQIGSGIEIPPQCRPMIVIVTNNHGCPDWTARILQ